MEGRSEGTPTFLFTDIEASTRKWERDAPAMSQALRRHDELLRKGIEVEGGLVFKTVGDAFCAAFADPIAALRAAVAIQRELGSEPWSLPDGLQVRMCLHTGPTERRDGDFFGQTLNRAARILSLANGGQILLSLATSEILVDHLPADVTLAPLGRHRLKDLSRPEILAQVVARGLRGDFPALRSMDGRPHNLPLEPTTFFDRTDAMLGIIKAFEDPACRLLTITGAGGVGKTRLALQAGAELLERHEGGAWFVDLSACRDRVSAISSIDRALGVREAAGRDSLEALVAWLSSRNSLLILDNLEQVEGAAVLVAELLSSCRDLHLLVTSRQALTTRWEHLFPLEPLALPDLQSDSARLDQYDAVRLFIDRARAARPSFRIDERNAPAVAALCVRLDGMPLAIELAAARIQAFSADEILQRLDNHLEFLDSEAPDLPGRQRTLRSITNWSYNLLSRDEKEAFRALSVFKGSFGLQAAEAVFRALSRLVRSARSSEILASLVGKSLIVAEEAESHSSYHLLETMRVFAAERLERTSEAETVKNAHADFYHRSAVKGRGSGMARLTEKEFYDAIGREHTSYLAAIDRLMERGEASSALELCCGIWRFWDLRGAYSEGIERFETCLAALGPAPSRPRSVGLRLLATLHRSAGRCAKAAELLAQSTALARDGGWEEELGSALVASGWNCHYLGDHASSAADFGEALEIGRRIDDRLLAADSRNGLGSVALVRGDSGTAIEELESALASFEELAETIRAARTAGNLAIAYVYAGRRSDARKLFERSEAFFREVGDRECALLALNNIACFELEDGSCAEALAKFLRAEREGKALGGGRNVAIARIGQSDALFSLGQTAEAYVAAESAFAAAEDSKLVDECGMALRARAQAAIALGDLERARSDARRAIELLTFAEDAAELEKADRLRKQMEDRTDLRIEERRNDEK